jgi:hypothetical protein
MFCLACARATAYRAHAMQAAPRFLAAAEMPERHRADRSPAEDATAGSALQVLLSLCG